ncbi:MAG: histidine phosphatase family protein [Dehalococcoidia bacterium]
MATQLCLVRHGIAGDADPRRWPDDRLRPLTDEGITKMREAARGLAEIFGAGAILSSPLLRARQTAEILMEAFDIEDLHISDALANGDDRQLIADVEALGTSKVFAVGHEPLMSRTLSRMLTGDPDCMSSVFKKGTSALVTFTGPIAAGQAHLEWLLQPAALRALK